MEDFDPDAPVKGRPSSKGVSFADFDPDQTPTSGGGEGQSPGVLGWGEALLEMPFKAMGGVGVQAGTMGRELLEGAPLEQAVEAGKGRAGEWMDWRAMERTRGAEETLGKAFETYKDVAGGGTEMAATSRAPWGAGDAPFAGMLGKHLIPGTSLGPQGEAPGLRSGAEAASELALFGIPGMLRRGRGAKPSETPEVTRRSQADIQQDLFQDPLGEYMQTPIEQGGRNLIAPEVRGEVTMQGGKMGGILDPRLKEQLERQLNPPFDVHERIPGQRELFTDYAKDEIYMPESARGFRETEGKIDPFVRDAPKLTEQEYYGPREKREIPVETVEFEKSTVKPGFLRDAVDLIRDRSNVAPLSEPRVRARDFSEISDVVEPKKDLGRKGPGRKQAGGFSWKDTRREMFGLHRNIEQYIPFKGEKLKTDRPELWPNKEGYKFERLHIDETNHPWFVVKDQMGAVFHADPRDFGLTEQQFSGLQNLITQPNRKLGDIGPGKRQRGGPALEKEVKRRGPTETLLESKRDFGLDRRPFQQMYKEDLEGKNLQDFSKDTMSYVGQMYQRGLSLVKKNLLQDTTLKLLMKTVEGTGPLIKWTVDQVSRIDRTAMGKIKEMREGVLKDFRQMYWHGGKVRRELLEGWDIWKQNIGLKDLNPSDFKTDRQYRVYQSFQDAYKKILDELNEVRGRHGFSPIERIPSYFNSSWTGDYRIFGYDKLGNKKFAVATSTLIGANSARRKLMKAHPELDWPKAEHVQKNKYGLMDLQSFEETLRVMSKDDPVTLAVQATYRDILTHRGFGRTGLHRKGIAGFLGSEPGFLGLRNMERSFDQYVQQAYGYMANLEKQTVIRDLADMPLKDRERLSETMDFLNSYIKKAQGGKLGGEQFWDHILTGLSKVIGTGETGPRKAIQELARIASIYWLLTPKFLSAQLGQNLYAIPKLIQEHGSIDAARFFAEGWKNTLSPDAIAKEAVEWAAKKAYLDPTLKNLVSAEIRHGEIPTSGGYETFKEFAMLPAAKIEHHLVRLPVFMMFEKALRDKIPDKEQRFSEAAEKMDYYMVNYGRVHSPMVYDRAGLMGDAARPLKQFSHNFFGQFIEYASRAKNKGEYAPLAAFFGVQALMAGLKGTLFVAEATAIITVLNMMFDSDIPTPAQMLAKSDLPDMLIFGGLSTLLGRDISSAVSAPGLPSMFSFPPIEFTANAVQDVYTFLRNKAVGIDTDQDRLRAAMAISPQASHEFLKNLWTPEGSPVANPNDPQLRGNYRRDEAEQWMSSIIGSKNLSESRTDMVLREAKKELARDAEHKMDALDAIADRVLNNKDVPDYLFEKYLRNGGDPTRLSQNLMDRIKQRAMTGEERMYDFRTLSPNRMHQLDIIKDYLDRNTPKETQQFNPETGELIPLPGKDKPGVAKKMSDIVQGKDKKGNLLREQIGDEEPDRLREAFNTRLMERLLREHPDKRKELREVWELMIRRDQWLNADEILKSAEEAKREQSKEERERFKSNDPSKWKGGEFGRGRPM